ncbi:hypothetical protein TNCV_2666751 [Trichonephila clavipes]|nr:hypothetical protein TNCV_2666751 [Trichonephila clavipes]
MIDKMIERVFDLVRQTNLDVNSDDSQELLDSQNQKLTMNELIEIDEYEQDIEDLECFDTFQSEYQQAFRNSAKDTFQSEYQQAFRNSAKDLSLIDVTRF